MKALEGRKYDGIPHGLRVFMESFRAKALMYRWPSVLDVPDADPNLPAWNFLTLYGVVTMDECAIWANFYMMARNQAAQDSQMMGNCILDSITTNFKTQLMMEVDKFTVHGYMEGLTLLKLLISKAQVDTIATVNMMRNSISCLPSKMVEVYGNLTEFNNNVKDIEVSLALYGQ
jgi:hypothetical protein